MAAAVPDVFAYLDYREYLAAYYAAKKSSGPFSYRAFSRRAKLKSPNYLKLVMDGQRSLGPTMAARFAEACGLKGDGARYFVDLVAYQQAATLDERNERYAKLTRYRLYQSAHRLRIAQDEYHSKWYLPAIRELAARSDFRDDPEWIARRLVPPITRREAALALEILEELQLLVRTGDGKVVQGGGLVTTGAETTSTHVASFHRTMMQHAAEALDRVPAEERDISSVTLCLGRDGLRRVKESVQRFRRELLELSELEPEPRQVVQINFQLFPLSQGSEVDS